MAVRWGKRGTRVNMISPCIIITPLANDELKGPRGQGYGRMLEVSAAGRAGTPDEGPYTEDTTFTTQKITRCNPFPAQTNRRF
ncbi:hypothetical protein [Granulicella sp. L60]|uniref:hypothetical protein n=1 Tax=Granulicella sp. L60 TaxID=1641866 RepID=UPI001C20636C|nr:hypothetical protein [Granulicella sp. L60]